ncbi:MAG: HNH endonuclease [Actinobacteria bacterium]|nr:HNH endonuclease [Actinomycetota bacterium]
MAGRGAGRGYGLDGHGTPLTPATVRRLACDARIIPAVLGTDGAILDLGRAARLASPDQVRYLRLRDKCCTFPGCDRPPSWCEAHHLREWTTDLGETNVDNLALLCTRHHTDVHTRGLIGQLIDGTIRWRRRQ